MSSQVNDLVSARPPRTEKETPEVYLVSVHVRDLLNVRRLPARLTVRQTGALLNCGEHDIPVLVSHGLLTPLGDPPPCAQKYFSPIEVLELAGDPAQMGKICNVLYRHWHDKNAAKSKKAHKLEPIGIGNGESRSKRLHGS
jgi:hypothetical protein